MPTACGFFKSHGRRLVGTFIVDTSPRHFTTEFKPRNQPFKCSRIKLTYAETAKLVGICKWSGTVGKDDLEMSLG